MGIALLALMALAAVAWMTYIVGTEMRNRAKGWKAVDSTSEKNVVIIYKWVPHWRRWAFLSIVYKVRKRPTEMGLNFFTAGCFTGRYDEMLERLDRKARNPIEREWYLDQLRKASLSR